MQWCSCHAGKPAGILSAKDQPEGVAFTTTNGAFEFVSTAKSSAT